MISPRFRVVLSEDAPGFAGGRLGGFDIGGDGVHWPLSYQLAQAVANRPPPREPARGAPKNFFLPGVRNIQCFIMRFRIGRTPTMAENRSFWKRRRRTLIVLGVILVIAVIIVFNLRSQRKDRSR